jgi:uncharacterized protein YbaR (Trm112 family)
MVHQHGVSLEELKDDYTSLVACPTCRQFYEFCHLMALPSLEHEPSRKRMLTWATTEM